jgi:hypothetical protein
MKREVQTMADVLRHVEAITVLNISKHVLSLPDSLIDGIHTSNILVRAPLALADDHTARVLRQMPEKVFDAQGHQLQLVSGDFPVMNLYDDSGNLLVRKEIIAKMGPRLILIRDDMHVVKSFVVAFINNAISEICCYPGYRPNQNDLLKYLEPAYRDLDWLQALKGNLAELRELIGTIIRPYAWSYHYVRQNRDGSVSIERGYDWRIVRYYEREFAGAGDHPET